MIRATFTRLFTWLGWAVTAVVAVFAVRRWLLMLAALLPELTRTASENGERPSVLLLSAIRNEYPILPAFLEALDGLAYPSGSLTIVLIDDGSTDDSLSLLESWTREAANRHLIVLQESLGKAAALNAALAAFPAGQFIAVYDADERPRPNALARLVGRLADPGLAAVTGQRAVGNPLASPAAGYATFENLVHQWITIRGKDRLGLAPAILGSNCVYRRQALEEVDFFQPGALLEDTDLTVRLAQAGWNTSFEPTAVSFHDLPETLSGYWRQHVRWARGFNRVASEQASPTLWAAELSPLLRLELLLFTAGYLDRLALLLGTGLSLLPGSSSGARRIIALSWLTPLFQVISALTLSRAPLALWRRIALLPFFFVFDMAASVTGLLSNWQQPVPIWEERQARL